jgi:DedD protein
VGSFGVRATSDRIAADLKHEGFSAFVVAFQSGNQTMYRVRVGPERDRASAEALLRKLKAGHPTATLVPPP